MAGQNIKPEAVTTEAPELKKLPLYRRLYPGFEAFPAIGQYYA